jgi:multiple sugar transport system ATP-binding protein
LQRALGVTVVLVTHDQVEAMSLSDRIAVMFAGRLAQAGSPDEVYRRPATLQVAEFIGDLPVNRLPVEQIGEGRIAALGMALPLRVLPRADAAMLAVRPEHVRILPADRRSGPGLAATVAHVEALGSDQAWHLVPAAAPTRRLIARQRSIGPEAFGEVGRPVWVRLDPAALMLFDEAGDRVEVVFAGEGEQLGLEAVP